MCIATTWPNLRSNQNKCNIITVALVFTYIYINGICTVYTGIRAVYAGIRWYARGIRVVYARYTLGFSGIRVVYARYTRGIRVVFAWYTRGIRVVYAGIRWYTLMTPQPQNGENRQR